MNERARIGYGGEFSSKAKVTFAGYVTCQPDVSNTVYDYLIDVGVCFLKVQVKTSKPNEKGRMKVDTRRSHAADRRYGQEDFDILSIVNADTGDVCFIDWKSAGCLSAVIVWVEPPDGNGRKRSDNPLMFEDFTDVEQAISSVMRRKEDAG